ncbi:MAG: nucleotide pyrophosphohydrolase [Isosphaeraceae bacterium]
MSQPTRDDQATLDDLKRWIRAFTDARDWGQFHHPKDLGLALAIEVGEILEHFRYKTNEQIAEALKVPETHRELAHELADCLWLIVRLADVCDVDLASSLREKLDLAGLKYPVDRSYGRSDKYTAYRDPPTNAPAPSPPGSGEGPSGP